MLLHTLRAAAAFLVILITYWAYALLVAPLVERPINYRPGTAGLVPGHSASLRDEDWQSQFKEGDWELQSRKVIETPQGMLLFKDYFPQPDGRIRIEPCTLIFYTSSSQSERGRPIVMRTPEGALLEFDPPLDPVHATIGRLVDAQLLGDVTIHSHETEAGKADDLRIETRNVHLAEDHIKTPHEVKFRYGRNAGSGRDLKIQLKPAAQTAQDGGPMFDGVRSLELFHVDRLRLYMPARSLFGADQQNASLPLPPLAGPVDAEEPVEVTCSGPYRFDFEKHVASFEDDVQVLHEVPGSASDRLTADRLEIHFARKDPAADVDGASTAEAKAEETQNMPVAGLTVERIVALGKPALLVSPSRGGEARAEHLEYDFLKRQIYLEDPRKVMLRGPQQYIEGVKLRYEMAPEGKLGRIWADGPGRFDGALRAEGGKRVVASWGNRLRLLPQDGLHVLSLVEAASVQMPEMGGFKAAEIHIWLREVEQPPQPADPALQLGRAAESQPPEWSGRSPNLPETEVLPDRMLAKGNVEIDTTRLVGDAQQLQAWFRYEPVAPNYEAGPTRAPAARPVNLQATHYQLPHAPPPPNAFSADQQRMTDRAAPPGANHRPISGHAPPTQPFDRGLGQQALPPGQPVSSEPPPKRFEMHGKLIQVQLLRRGEEDPELETATIEGQAVLRGLTAGAPQEPPLDVRGDKLHMTGGEANAVVHVFGKPATVAARGLTMNAANIHLDRPGNRLWIDGPGMMTLPPKAAQSLGGAGSSPGAPIHVTWQERMEFDGNTVHFERDVRTRSRQPGERGAWTDLATYGDVLDASVSRFVDFSADEQDFKDDKVELRRLVYDGGVFVEAHGFDPRGQREAWDRMQIPNLTLDQLTGEITSRGAGWIQSVRLGGGDLLAGGPLSAPTRPAAPSDSGKRELTYTRVDYQQGIGGNLHNREVVFRDQVQTVHGPVPVWDAVLYADRPDGLGEKGVVIHCDELSLYEMGPWVTSRRKAVELVAAGNAVVEGRTFNAHANRLKYAEAKDLVVLEGDGRRDAELWRQEQIGGARSHAAARQIWFWRGENRIEVDDAKFIVGAN